MEAQSSAGRWFASHFLESAPAKIRRSNVRFSISAMFFELYANAKGRCAARFEPTKPVKPISASALIGAPNRSHITLCVNHVQIGRVSHHVATSLLRDVVERAPLRVIQDLLQIFRHDGEYQTGQ